MDKTKVLVIIALLISICSFGKEVSNIPGQASADNENIPQSSGRPVQTLRGVVNDRASGHPIPDRKSTRLNSSHDRQSRMPSSA